jgi:hypothetical protein
MRALPYVCVAVLAGVAVPRAGSAQEAAAQPRAIYIPVDEPATPLPAPGDVQPRRILFMNRHGGVYTPGQDSDSSQNISSIIGQTYGINGWVVNDEIWRDFMSCSRIMWGRFNVEVTDVEPPPSTPYIEAVVSGSPGDVGFEATVGGVSPWTCGTIERSIVFVFADIYSGDSRRVCEVAAQEIAHSFALDHEYLCADPMTYLGGCGPKTFQNIDAPCGESAARTCQCTNLPTQNSVTTLLDRAGAAETEPPTVAFSSPHDGDTVQRGFTVVADAHDNYVVSKVDLWIDGVSRTGTGVEPFMLTAPSDLTAGPHMLELRAYDPAGNVAKTSISVTVAGECQGTGQSTCEAGRVCQGGVCLADLGTTCSDQADCAHLCTQTCSASMACPDGFDCSTAAGGSVSKCWPATGGGGCRADGHDHGAAGAGLLVVLGAVIARARRRRRR